MSKPSPTSGHQKTKYWRKHLNDWQCSGLSQRQYCLKHSLKKYTFLYWRKKFANEGKRLSLIPVTVVEEQSSSPEPISSGLVLRCSDRYSVELSVDFDGPSLKRLVEVLENS